MQFNNLSIPEQTETFEGVFEYYLQKAKNQIRVGTLARITSVTMPTINAQPIVREKVRTKNGYKFMALPEIRNIRTLQGNLFNVGDICVLLHLDRTIGDAFNGAEWVDSDDNRHDLNDCIAIGLNN